jgi:acyl carrier protein
LADQIYRETAAQKVYDLYGPSETTTYSTGALRKPGDLPTIGRPLANQQVYLLDPDLKPVPIGAQGELYIGGEGLARGYLNRPELTAEKFIRSPFRRGERLYRTGDLARWRADGNLEFLRRMDHQVKIRGFRIELGEIETVLRQHPELAEAVVVVREPAPGDKRLVAYLVSRPGETVSAEPIRGFLKARLPEHMVPVNFVFLEKLPLTPNGKVDRNALPEVVESRPNERAVVPPRTPVETSLLGIWREVLGRTQISVNDNFFELGGHSLLATQVISRIRGELHLEVPLSSVFDAPTIAALAERLSAGEWSRNGTSVPTLEPVPRNGLLPASFVQERLWVLDQLQPGGHSYNVPIALRLRGALDANALGRALDELIRRHEAMRTVFVMQDGNLCQVIQPPFHLALRSIELHAQSCASREQEARKAVQAEARRPFDLGRGPLLRGVLVQLGPSDHILGIVMHHTISDGWSLAVFFKDLEMLYTAFVADLPLPAMPELAVQCADFAVWQRKAISGEMLEAELAWWKDTLKDAPPSVQLPSDPVNLPNEQSAARAGVTLPGEFSPVLNAFGQEQTSTPFMICLTALAITIQRWTRQGDLVLGTVVAGRNRREFENVIGCFVNFLPLRVRVSDGETARELLSRTRTVVLNAQAHQDCPFQDIVQAINPKRRTDQNPLYNVALLLQNFPARLFQTPTLVSELVPVEPEAPLLDLRFEAEATGRWSSPDV